MSGCIYTRDVEHNLSIMGRKKASCEYFSFDGTSNHMGWICTSIDSSGFVRQTKFNDDAIIMNDSIIGIAIK